MLTTTAQTQLVSTLLSVGKLAGALASTIDTVGRQVPGGMFLKRRATPSIAVPLAWTIAPMFAAGAAYWAVSAWRWRKARQQQAEALAVFSARDMPAPKDRVDDSSWESFPASGASAASSGRSIQKPISQTR